jgi:UDP-N-acetylglucosamine--N-acetylmuramyl-(pentapeptide) pyrophosphoryl-undecaprenol N-acetylglucosamine transferase
MLNAAQQCGTPTVIQEQNSYAGKSNKLLGRKARAVCVAYEGMEKFFPASKLHLTGNPVRAMIARSEVSQAQGQEWLNMDRNKRTLLILGGSLGAVSINEAIGTRLRELLDLGLQVLWQTGAPYYQEALRLSKEYEGRVKVLAFIKEMDQAYAAADVIVSRAGALAISELCIVGKPVVFVPYPFAAEDHQTSNAMTLVRSKAALLVKDSDARQELVEKIKFLEADLALQFEMKVNLKAMAIRDADERIASKIMELATEQ